MKNQINSTIENLKNKLKIKSICIPARGESMLPTIGPNQKVIVDAISPKQYLYWRHSIISSTKYDDNP